MGCVAEQQVELDPNQPIDRGEPDASGPLAAHSGELVAESYDLELQFARLRNRQVFQDKSSQANASMPATLRPAAINR